MNKIILLAVISLFIISCTTTPVKQSITEFDEPKVLPTSLIGDFKVIEVTRSDSITLKTETELNASQEPLIFQISPDFMYEAGNNNFIESGVILIAENTLRKTISNSNDKQRIGETDIIEFKINENELIFTVFNEKNDAFIKTIKLIRQ